jgi:hypothetical protein
LHGDPLKAIYPYATQHKITNNDRVKHHQYNTLAHCRVQLAEQCYNNESATHFHTINLFGINLLQESSDNLRLPPMKRRPKKLAADKHGHCRYIEEEAKDNKQNKRNDDYDDDEYDDNDGGKREY